MKMKDLFPIALGIGAVWLLMRWREVGSLFAREETTPDTATGASAPGVSGSIGGGGGGSDDGNRPWVQAAESWDEFSDTPVAMGGALPIEDTIYPSQTVHSSEPYAYTDEVTAEPIARLDETPVPQQRSLSGPRTTNALPTIRPDHRIDVARPAGRPRAGAPVPTLKQITRSFTPVAPAVAAPRSGPGSASGPATTGFVTQKLSGGGTYVGAAGKNPAKVAANIVKQVTGKPPAPRGGKKT